MSKIWFSFFDRSVYKGKEPFYTPSNNVEGLSLLEENHRLIAEEFNSFINNTDPFKEYFNKTTVSASTRWKTFSLRYWNKNYVSNQKYFPILTSIINKIPNCVSCSFSLLEANSHIKPHCGDTNAIWRCHHALVVPAQLPIAGLKVGNESKSWEEGKTIVFCDAHLHESWNMSNKHRYVIILDIIKPEFVLKTSHICAVVRSSISLQKVAEKHTAFYKAPIAIQVIGFACVYVLKRFSLLFRRF